MNHIQEKTFTLLKEVITICESSGIRYYAGSETLRLAMVFGGHSSESVNLDILIPAEDMMKFVEAARKTMKSGRAVEYMGNNKYFSLFEINYVDTTTTFLNVKEGWDVACPGARIIIRPIRRNVTGFRHTYNGVLESGMERTGYRAFRKISGKNVLSVLLVYLHSIFGRAAMSRRMFRRFTKVYSGMSEIVLIKRHRGRPGRWRAVTSTAARALPSRASPSAVRMTRPGSWRNIWGRNGKSGRRSGPGCIRMLSYPPSRRTRKC